MKICESDNRYVERSSQRSQPMEALNSKPFHAIILGAGPAGTGPLVGAMRQGCYKEMLDKGVLWVDPRPTMGAGNIGKYDIDADSAAGVFLECLEGLNNPLSALNNHSSAQVLRMRGTEAPPLPNVGSFLDAVGSFLVDQVNAARESRFISGVSATGVAKQSNGYFTVALSDGSKFEGRRVVFAMGGYQVPERVITASISPELSLGNIVRGPMILTSEIFREGGVAKMCELLRVPNARVVILGSAHSSGSVVHLVLSAPDLELGQGSVTWMFRRTPRLMYPSVEAAHSDGYFEFDKTRDVCPASGRVYRLAGLRMAGREQLRRALGLGGLTPDQRLRMMSLDETSTSDIHRILQDATIVVPAFGYRPRTVPVIDENGAPIKLLAEELPQAPMVDRMCRVLDSEGKPVPNLLGIGLASGFIPHRTHAGWRAEFYRAD
ncbi:Aminotransferase DegT [Mycena sanguinolenta]|uniref:Aminotransferase DegT n=1 Tax=Mycena sanguinolenta TaxID=230812 RepID=A0A8H6X8G2_9AGAR|nr:Aminotransferase DegT [Mycena sanguinolenta]